MSLYHIENEVTKSLNCQNITGGNFIMKRLFITSMTLFILVACSISNSGEKITMKASELSTVETHIFALLGDPAFIYDLQITGDNEKEVAIFVEHYINGEEQTPVIELTSSITAEESSKVVVFQRAMESKCQWIASIFSENSASTLETDPLSCHDMNPEEFSTVNIDTINIELEEEAILAKVFHANGKSNDMDTVSLQTDDLGDIPQEGNLYVMKVKVKDAH